MICLQLTSYHGLYLIQLLNISLIIWQEQTWASNYLTSKTNIVNPSYMSHIDTIGTIYMTELYTQLTLNAVVFTLIYQNSDRVAILRIPTSWTLMIIDAWSGLKPTKRTYIHLLECMDLMISQQDCCYNYSVWCTSQWYLPVALQITVTDE